jgi:hypothetical protein
MIWSLAGLLLPAIAVWPWLRALTGRTPGASGAVDAAIAFCVGLGLSSLITFWSAVLLGGVGPWFAAADALLWAIVGAAGWLRLRGAPRDSEFAALDSGLTRDQWLVRGVFAAIAVTVAAAAFAQYLAAPYGLPDATLIWNLKARFMIRGGDAWTAFVQVPWSNPSHPLLVPASVARLWAYAGAELTLVPLALAAATGAAIVAAVMGALDVRRTRAWVAACVLVAPWTFGQSLAAQTADLPFSLYVVVTLIVMLRHVEAGTRDARHALLIAGVLGGLVAWTKNEGLVFLIVVLGMAAWLAVRAGQGRVLGWMLAGAAPALVTVAWVKLGLAPVPPEYFARAEGLSTIGERLMDPARYALVAQLTWQRWVQWGGPMAAGALPIATMAAVAAACTRAGRPARRLLAVLGLMFVSYAAVWLSSPLDTTWLVSMTFDRLLLQLWPSLVFVAFSYRHAVGAGEGRAAAALGRKANEG